MNQEHLLVNLDANMTALATVINSSIGLFLIGGWTAFQREKTISFSQIKLSPRQAHFLFSFAFFLINLTTIVIIGKIYFILSIIEKSYAAKAVTIVATHPWAFNPFTYAGDGGFRNMFSASGIFLLIIIWWTCPSCIVLFRGTKQRPYHRAYFFLYTIAGISILLGIYNVLCRLSTLSSLPDFSKIAYEGSICFKIISGVIGVLFGLSLYVCVRMKYHAEAVDLIYAQPSPLSTQSVES